jgi:hypothetical protein
LATNPKIAAATISTMISTLLTTRTVPLDSNKSINQEKKELT